ncbi:MAG: ATP-binding protein, partial [Patescibacteria group bacterium]
ESIEVTSIASISGTLNKDDGLIQTRPFRSPHHSSSAVSLIGGGTWPMPGEISLAHRGVLFLDELPEFPRHVIEHLRQPLEDGTVTIARSHATVKFPAQFILVAAMNPCPCGYASDPKHPCICSHMQIQNYKKRVSGPLLDRFDLRIEVSNLSKDVLLNEARTESSTEIRLRVTDARKKQTMRFTENIHHLNTSIPPHLLDHFCPITPEARILLGQAIELQNLSPRGCTRVRKVARTIADLSNFDLITEDHLAEALQFRGINGVER